MSVSYKADYLPVACKLLAVSDLTPTEKLFKVERPGSFTFKPGQFVQISILGLEEAPISISNSPTRESSIELAVRRVGTLTGALHGLNAGDTVGLRGPFGSSFDVKAFQGKDLLLIAGGCGLAPMRSLIQYCEDRRDEFGRVTILYGAKSPMDVLFADEIRQWSCSEHFECRHTVDDIPQGTCFDGHVGLITTLIPPLAIDPFKTIAVIVGPPVMYRYVIRELENKGLTKGQIVVSLERYMRCGVGKCGHCVIDHLYCCLDGPVFWLNDVHRVKGAL